MPAAQVVPTPQMASKRKSTAACNGSNGLSTTGSAPRVQRPMKAAKSPAARPSGIETAATKPVPSSIPEDYPFEHKDNIACPFPKHNPDRYTHVRESCTIGWGFSDTGKLNEHIRRVHTRSFGCLRCGHRFTNISKPKLTEAKAAHKCSKETTVGKEFKPDPRFGPEWLDERQEAAYFDLNFARGNSSEAPQVVFERIFNALWPEVPQKDIPSHLHMPGFFQATHKVEQMRQEMNRQAKQLRQSGQEKDQQIEALKEQIRNMNATAMQRYGWHPQRESGPAIPTALLTSKHKANRIYNADLVPGMRQTPSFSTDPRTLGNILSDTLPPEFAFTVRDDGPPSLDSGLGSTGHSEGEAGPFSGMMATQDPSLSPQNWMDSNLLPDHNYELITEYSKSGIYPAYLNTSDSDELAMVLDPSWPPIEMEIEI